LFISCKIAIGKGYCPVLGSIGSLWPYTGAIIKLVTSLTFYDELSILDKKLCFVAILLTTSSFPEWKTSPVIPSELG